MYSVKTLKLNGLFIKTQINYELLCIGDECTCIFL